MPEPELDHLTLAIVDDDYDWRHASNGSSRFGAYLDQHAHRLDDNGFPAAGAEFAALAWAIAVAAMSPGYVRIRPDLLAVTANPAEDDPANLVLRITVPLPHRALAHRPGPGPWRDWETDCYDRGPWSPKVDPCPGLMNTLTLTADILLPVPAEALITPTTTRPGTELTRTAKLLVTMLAEHINDRGGPAVASLLGATS
ncbi:hypothetical protein [Kitasatospora sp. NPDC059803]|uniref:hypothetical protein n=1 Tax=Kitasatospora sp. NPDC059803 TaxID=3346953 RepID=UPI003665B3F9